MSFVIPFMVKEACRDDVDPPMWLIKMGCHWGNVRRFCRAVRVGQIYVQPDNWLELTLGHGLDLCGGDYTLVRVAALVAAVTARILEAVELCGEIHRQSQLLSKACRGYEILLPPVAWCSKPRYFWLSPSTDLALRLCWQRRYRQGQLVLNRSWHLLLTVVKLLQVLAEISDALNWEPDSHHRHVREVFVNIDKTIGHLADNGPLLVAHLKQQTELVESLLKILGAPCQSQAFIRAVEQTTHAASRWQSYLEPFKKRYNDYMMELAKRAVVGTAASLGALDFVPKSLWPKVFLPSVVEVVVLAYPPRERVCLVSKRIAVLAEMKAARLADEILAQQKLEKKKVCEQLAKQWRQETQRSWQTQPTGSILTRWLSRWWP